MLKSRHQTIHIINKKIIGFIMVISVIVTMAGCEATSVPEVNPVSETVSEETTEAEKENNETVTGSEETAETTQETAEETTVGDTEMIDKTTTLRFESFDGGGPRFDVIIEDESIVSYSAVRKYASEDHEMMTGAGYDEVFTFTGIKPGETNMRIEARSPIADNFDANYKVVVSEDLSVKIEELSVSEAAESVDEDVDP